MNAEFMATCRVAIGRGVGERCKKIIEDTAVRQAGDNVPYGLTTLQQLESPESDNQTRESC